MCIRDRCSAIYALKIAVRIQMVIISSAAILCGIILYRGLGTRKGGRGRGGKKPFRVNRL